MNDLEPKSSFNEDLMLCSDSMRPSIPFFLYIFYVCLKQLALIYFLVSNASKENGILPVAPLASRSMFEQPRAPSTTRIHVFEPNLPLHSCSYSYTCSRNEVWPQGSHTLTDCSCNPELSSSFPFRFFPFSSRFCSLLFFLSFWYSLTWLSPKPLLSKTRGALSDGKAEISLTHRCSYALSRCAWHVLYHSTSVSYVHPSRVPRVWHDAQSSEQQRRWLRRGIITETFHGTRMYGGGRLMAMTGGANLQ
jgi:hypothetical protein